MKDDAIHHVDFADDPFDLQRFVEAQERTYASAR